MEKLKLLTNIDTFNSFISNLTPSIGRCGGRYLKNGNGTYTLNEITQSLEKIVKCESDQKKIVRAVKQIRHLDQSVENVLSYKNTWIKILTAIRQFFGNLFYNRDKVLLGIQFPNQKPVTSIDNYKVLHLKGDQGTVACRVRGISKDLFPRLSENNAWEHMFETYLRVRNLISVRGSEENARMVGPCDYYGNLEKPFDHEYTIKINEGIPIFFEHKKGIQKVDVKKEKNNALEPPATVIKAEWISGNDLKAKGKQLSDTSTDGDSLFKQKGILKMTGGQSIELKKFDATKYDLSSYKARLVKNDEPFHITHNRFPSSDDYRAVSYQYQPGYADYQVKKGGGLFLETHPFAQTMTPLDENSGGYVTLAKWKDASKKELEMVAVEIPFGYTLVVEEYAIHGDATLDGTFMMCMTSNHETMAKADTVFLKTEDGTQNIAFKVKGGHKKSDPKKSELNAPPPIVNYKKPSTPVRVVNEARRTFRGKTAAVAG